MEEAFATLQSEVATCLALEARMRGSRTTPAKGKQKEKRPPGLKLKTVQEILERSVTACSNKRKRMAEEAGPGEDKGDAALSQYARFTDAMALDPYKQFLHYVPRLVNVVRACQVPGFSFFSFFLSSPVSSPSLLTLRMYAQVTLAEALPVPGSGLTLPLNLQEIAAKCTGAFYAPRRFAVCFPLCKSTRFVCHL